MEKRFKVLTQTRAPTSTKAEQNLLEKSDVFLNANSGSHLRIVIKK